jgi:hypothetical protein
MKWVTRRQIHVNRTATGWLIRRFLDPKAEILFVEPDQVSAIQGRQGATGFDATGAKYHHRHQRGRSYFKPPTQQNILKQEPLQRLARIVHGADFPAEMDVTPQSAGLWAISQGFTDVGKNDDDILDRASFLYDSLYAHLKREEEAPQ